MVTAVGLLNCIFGGVYVLLGLYVIFLGSALRVLSEDVGGFTWLFGVLILAFGVTSITAGVGVFQRQEWGRHVTLVLGWIEVAGCILSTIVWTFIPPVYAAFVLSVLFRRAYAAEFSAGRITVRHWPHWLNVLGPAILVIAAWITIRVLDNASPEWAEIHDGTPTVVGAFDLSDLERTRQWAKDASENLEATASKGNALVTEKSRERFVGQCRAYVGRRVNWRLPVIAVTNQSVEVQSRWPEITVVFEGPQNGAERLDRFFAGPSNLIPIGERGVAERNALRLTPKSRDRVVVQGTIREVGYEHGVFIRLENVRCVGVVIHPGQ